MCTVYLVILALLITDKLIIQIRHLNLNLTRNF